MYVYAMYSQSIPVNAPPLVMPSSVKADLGRVENEIPRYKPWISSTSWIVWEEFLNTKLMSFFNLQDHTSNWNLDVLAETPSSVVNTSTHEENSDLAAMFATEQAPCRVRINKYI